MPQPCASAAALLLLFVCCCCEMTHHAVNLVCCDTGRNSSVCGIKRLTTNPAAAAAAGTHAQEAWGYDPVHCSTRAVLANTVQLSVCKQRGVGGLEHLSPAGFPDACYLFWAAYGHAALLPAVHLTGWVASASIVRPHYVLRHLHTHRELQGQPTSSQQPCCNTHGCCPAQVVGVSPPSAPSSWCLRAAPHLAWGPYGCWPQRPSPVKAGQCCSAPPTTLCAVQPRRRR